MLKHTKGPWRAQEDCRHYLNEGVITEGPLNYGIYSEKGRLAVMEDFDNRLTKKEQAANAKLIEAAPELKIVLEDMLADYGFNRCDEKRTETIETAKKLLARIEGRIR